MPKNDTGKKCLVYLITNNCNGKLYVGISVEINKRWKLHQYRAKTGWKEVLYCAIRKHGIENFTIEQIDEAPNIADAHLLEIYYIKELNTHVSGGYGYNMTYGGEGTVGWDPPPEWRAAVSLRFKGQTMSVERKAEYSKKFSGSGNPRYGTKWSPELREKIINASKARALAEGREYKAWAKPAAKKHYRMLTLNGDTKNLSEWCRELDLSMHMVSKRLDKYGYSVEDALTVTKGKGTKDRGVMMHEASLQSVMNVFRELKEKSPYDYVQVKYTVISNMLGLATRGKENRILRRTIEMLVTEGKLIKEGRQGQGKAAKIWIVG